MFNNKIKLIKSSNEKVYQQDIDFINKLSELNRNHELKKKRKELKTWYRKNREEINYLFNKIMQFMDKQYIIRNQSTQEIYDNFIEYCFANSSI